MRESILLVEDDRATRHLFASALREEGYRVLEAGKLADAREIMKGESPALIVLDGLLPDGTGVQFASELRRDSVEVQVIFMTSFFRDLTSYRQLTKELDATKVLYKPVSTSTMVELVRKTLDDVAPVELGAKVA